ncbi:MAG: M15 family metallopeptidase [Ruminococcus sp.]|jgi:D-alanyl-D-alanine carboxypeptidase|nr:M15 family metallopeptidase [Ruminococcus sp.]
MNKRANSRTAKAIIAAILLLLAIVLAVSIFDKPPEGGEAQSGTEPSTVNSVIGIGTDVQTAGSSGEITSGDDSSVNVSTPPADAVIDNEWALYLVNEKNPLPSDYDETIETTLVFSDFRDYYFDSRAASYLTTMIEDAAADGVNLYIVSTYRSQEYQKENFERSVAERMSAGMDYDAAYADTLREVTLPGYSEHNAGIAADIMTPSYTSMNDDGFKTTEAYAWLSEHAAEYGFILRYPEGKEDVTGIIYEPWHYRFVGVYYAEDIKAQGVTLEEYFAENGWLDPTGKAQYNLGPIGDVSPDSVQKYVTPDPNAITVTVASSGGEAIVV